MVSSSAMSPPHSCIRSLSDEQMTTFMPAAAAARASVAMTSSASNAGHRQGPAAEGVDQPVDQLDLRRQLGRHGRAVGLVRR